MWGMRRCGQKMLVEAAGGFNRSRLFTPFSGLAFVIVHRLRHRLLVNIEGGKRWEGLVLFTSFPFPAAGYDCR